MNKTDLMRNVRDEILKLEESPLFAYRTKNNYFPVIGEGNHDADIVFIGEAPGKNEALQGKPFCGASGRVLDEIITSINLSRKDVYITNIVKDRPPENRDPTPAEIALYSPFLDAQINIIEPKVIATLGRFSMKYILEKFKAAEHTQTITSLHGKIVKVNASFGHIHIAPLYHPAVALYSGSKKQVLIDDAQILKQFI